MQELPVAPSTALAVGGPHVDGPYATSGRLVVAPVQPRRTEMVVRVQGEVDLATAPRLEAVLEQAVVAMAAEDRVDASPQGAVPRVVCDLDGVTFLCAAGLTVLQRVTALAASRHVDWVVLARTRPARRVVELTGMDRVVPLRTTPAAR